jgi:DNA-binding CsgD family transcriptional regulator
MAKEVELLDTAAALYEATLEPEAWGDALSRVGGLINADWSLLGVYRHDGCPEFLAQDAAGDAEHFALFNDHYAQPDTNPSIPLLLAADLGAIIVREQVYTDEVWRRTPLYEGIYRPRDLYHGLGAVVLDEAPHVAFLGVNRVKRSSPFTAPDLDLLRAVLPHMRRALQVFLRLAAGNSQQRGHEQVWDMLACGVILLDAAGKISWMNRSAATVLVRADGLTMRKGALTATNARENTALQLLVRQTVATQQGLCLRPGGSLRVSRPSQRRPLALSLSPIHVEQSFAPRPAAVAFVTDPDRDPELVPEKLRRLYGLTVREAAVVAELVRGRDLHEAAERLDMSVHTARTLLRFVFRKTDTHRQSELVGLVLRGPEGLR